MSIAAPAVPRAASDPADRPRLANSIPFSLVHLGALGALFVPFEPRWVGLAIGLYFVRMFGVTAGYHRYFSHRSFKTSRVGQFLFAWLAMSSGQKGILWWAAHHRRHHRFADQEEDVHSPTLRGLWWAHVGWILSPRNNETDFARVADLARYPELRWLDRWYALPPAALATALFVWGGLPALFWGFFVSTVLLLHGTFTINSLAHLFGTRRYPTADTSRNNWFLALLTLGEGWHNNHHFYRSSANQGFFWWELDPTFYVLKALSWTGLIWDLRKPPRHVVKGHLRPVARPAS
ncbi:MAG TPA: acyl-CoA desaturase [Thermoanaerobaculia bacterium]|nr:acyl-CoA desaturase [Thermoanaerobaculia bacterium]